jgi:hypothetical protein
MKRIAILAILLSMALTGCRTISGAIAEPDVLAADTSHYPGKATIVVFRGSGRGETMYAFQVLVDKNKVGSIRRERYISFPAAEGAHAVTVTCPPGCTLPAYTLNFNATAGKTYYFKINMEMAMSSRIGGGLNIEMASRFAQIDSERAAQLMTVYEPGKRVD